MYELIPFINSKKGGFVANQKNQQMPTSRPAIKRKVTLKSFQAQKAFGLYKIMSKSCFALAVNLRLLLDADQIQKLEKMVDEEFTNIFKEMEMEKNRLKALAESNGIEEDEMQANHTNPLVLDVEITSPRLGKYILMLEKLDSLMGAVGSLWLMGIIDDEQYSKATFDWRKKVIRCAAKISKTINRVMSEYYRNKNQKTKNPKDKSSEKSMPLKMDRMGNPVQEAIQ